MWEWIDKRRGSAMFIAGLAASSAAWFWWVAGGGIAPFIHSARALNDTEISATLVSLPVRLAELETQVGSAVERGDEIGRLLEEVRDTLDSFRAQSERIVEWAPTVSQRLTDEAGGCFAGEDCTVYFRGRKTLVGARCEITRGQPYLYIGDSEYPINFARGYAVQGLTENFQTLPVTVELPDFVPEGRAGLIVVTYYADCPFAPGQVIERATFRLNVTVHGARN